MAVNNEIKKLRPSPSTGIAVPRGSRIEDLTRDEVRTVRERLNAMEIPAGPKLEDLREAVKAFQKKMKIQVDGKIGAQTWAALHGKKAGAGQRTEMLLSPERIAHLAQQYGISKENIAQLGKLAIVSQDYDDFQKKALLHLPNRISNTATVNALHTDLTIGLADKPQGWSARFAGRPSQDWLAKAGEAAVWQTKNGVKLAAEVVDLEVKGVQYLAGKVAPAARTAGNAAQMWTQAVFGGGDRSKQTTPEPAESLPRKNKK